MKKIIKGIISGIIFGAIDVVMMIPLSIPNKTTAMLGAFINRFAIGLLISSVN